MAEEILRQVNFTGGEIDPKLIGRRDFKGYYTSVVQGANTIVAPQGGIYRRPGLAHIDAIRGPMSKVSLVGANITPMSGGPASGILDGSSPLQTTAVMGTTDPYVVLEIDFPGPTGIGAVDVEDYAIVDTGATPSVPAPPPFYYPPSAWAGGDTYEYGQGLIR